MQAIWQIMSTTAAIALASTLAAMFLTDQVAWHFEKKYNATKETIEKVDMCMITGWCVWLVVLSYVV